MLRWSLRLCLLPSLDDSVIYSADETFSFSATWYLSLGTLLQLSQYLLGWLSLARLWLAVLRRCTKSALQQFQKSCRGKGDHWRRACFNLPCQLHLPLARSLVSWNALHPGIFIQDPYSYRAGYALIKFKAWRDAYWISFSLNGVGFFFVLFFYHPQNQYILEEGKTRRGQVMPLDYVGLFTFTGGLVLFLMGLSFGGVTYSW